jgi:hypothetical protein
MPFRRLNGSRVGLSARRNDHQTPAKLLRSSSVYSSDTLRMPFGCPSGRYATNWLPLRVPLPPLTRIANSLSPCPESTVPSPRLVGSERTTPPRGRRHPRAILWRSTRPKSLSEVSCPETPTRRGNLQARFAPGARTFLSALRPDDGAKLRLHVRRDTFAPVLSTPRAASL